MSPTETTAEAAAAVTADILGEAAQTLAGDPAGDNAARMLAEMGQPVAAPQTAVVSSPTPAAETAEPPAPVNEPEPIEPQPELTFEPQLSDELQELLDTPDFEEEALAEVVDERDPDEYDETFDPQEAAKERAKDKRIKFLEERLVQANKGKWVAENKKAYPLLATYAADELSAIEATSRRGFAREAARLNERYTKVLGPALQDLAAAKASVKAEVETEVRSEASKNWGLPVAEPGGAAAFSEQERALLEARERRAPLAERLKILAGIRPV